MHRSKAVVRYIDTVSRIEAVAAVLIRDGHEVWTIKTFVTRNDRNYPAIGSVWSHGNKLPYTADDHRRIGFARQDAGHILLDVEFFQLAAQSGFTFEMQGLRGRYRLDVPAAIFEQALAQYKTTRNRT